MCFCTQTIQVGKTGDLELWKEEAKKKHSPKEEKTGDWKLHEVPNWRKDPRNGEDPGDRRDPQGQMPEDVQGLWRVMCKFGNYEQQHYMNRHDFFQNFSDQQQPGEKLTPCKL